MDLLGRALRCHDYIRSLEEERKKIEVFQRELPLCLRLVTQVDAAAAIESVRHRAGAEEGVNEGPVLEEFIPLKPSPTSTLSDEERGEARKSAAAIGWDRKPEWLRSVQLWNQEPDTDLKVPPKKPIAVSLKKIGGAFQPFDREKHVAPPAVVAVAPPASSTAGGGDGKGGVGGCADVDGSRSGGRDKEKEGQSQPHRKARRCWSPELHRRFLQALQQLGGSHDSAAAAPGNGACAPPDSIYAPVASVPSDSKLRNQQLKQQWQRSIARPLDTEGGSGGEDDNSMRDGGDATNTASPTTSATSQTTTASPLF
ncbi:hypothetical protein GW17_00032348 [Ensete ventricosum]|nr:hypothetical protein GW17_00032348 [Ensete ventricosum]